MRRFIVPAIIVVDVQDNRDQAFAEELAAAVQSIANRTKVYISHSHCVMLDEKLPTVEVPIHPDETEIPGAYPMTEMALCEVPHICLKPQAYRFIVMPGCPNCEKAAKEAAGD